MRYHSFVVLCFVLAGCSNSANDPLLAYENQSAAAIYKQAKYYSDQGDAKKSSDAYAALRAFHPESSLVKRSLSESLKMNMKHSDYAEAIAVADRILAWYPASDIAEMAYFYKGQALLSKHRSWLQTKLDVSQADLSKSQLEQARSAYKVIVQQFPHGKYFVRAKLKIKQITKYLAQHELHIAKFYLRKGNIAAASDRVKLALSIDKSLAGEAGELIKQIRRTGRGAAW